MKKANCWIGLIFIVLSLGILHSFVFAQHDSKSSRQTLKGLKEISVLIELLDPQIEREGLTRDQLQRDTELKLRLAGIRVTGLEEQAIKPYMSCIYVRPGVLKDMYRYVYTVDVQLIQEVSLVRTPNIRARAVTWLYSVTGVTSEVEDIRTATKDLVDRFINAYLSVNPK
ncbi:MAG: hypothetical protein ACFFCW_39275 [Candidatus Hodarchaeota archaeon]